MNHSPETESLRLLRLKEVLKIVPIKRSTLWQWVKDKKFPAPIKLGPNTTCWRLSSIQKFVDNGEV